MDNVQSLMIESVQLLLIGMGSVFIILGILIFLISTVSRILPEEVVEHFPTANRATPAQTKNDNKELIAVISMAINAFRKSSSSN